MYRTAVEVLAESLRGRLAGLAYSALGTGPAAPIHDNDEVNCLGKCGGSVFQREDGVYTEQQAVSRGVAGAGVAMVRQWRRESHLAAMAARPNR